MSLHREDSELTRLNANAAAKPVTVSEELFHVISSAQRIAQATDGSFDVTIRPIADLWGFIWKQHRLPTPSEIETVLAHVGYQHVHLNATNRAVHFAKPGISIDLGAIAKGYAVDCAIEKLRERGVTNALVRAGGDLRAMGRPRDRAAWEVQIEDPERQGSRTTIRLNSAALSTSGNYENFFVVDGRRYSHILNPKTGMPIEGVAACSVRAATCMESDAWATALFVQGPEQSLTKFGERLAFQFTLIPAGSNHSAASVKISPRWTQDFPTPTLPEN